MAVKTRKTVHVSVELNVDNAAQERDIRRFVKEGIDKYRATLLQGNLLATTPPVTVIRYKEIG